jgi:hypothetical protein
MTHRIRSGLTQYFKNHVHPRGIIVSPERKFIYMKATKTAGTSILRGVLEPNIPGIFHQKDHPQEYQNWIDGINDELLEDYYIFTIVRNPWDRVVSIATYFDIPLKEFLNNFEGYCKDQRIRIHALPLHWYTHLDDKQFVDAICRFEVLQPDMNLVFDRIDLPRTKLPFMNPSDHKHYSTYYGPDEIHLVEKLYQKDIAYYGYMFEDDPRTNHNRTHRKRPFSGLFKR